MTLHYKSTLLTILIVMFLTNGAMAQMKSGGQNLLRHIVVVTFKPGTSNSQIQAVDNSFKNLSKLNMVKNFEWGVGLDDRDTLRIKHVYSTTFASKIDEDSYGASPQHQKHIKLGAEYIEDVRATDYWVSK